MDARLTLILASLGASASLALAGEEMPLAETVQVVAIHGWYDSPVLIALLSTIGTVFAIVWQGRKTRVSAEAVGQKQEIMGERAMSAAALAGEVGKRAADAAIRASDIGARAEWAATRASEDAKKAAAIAQANADVNVESAKVSQATHDIVNSQRTAMEKAIADLRAEIASLRGQPRPSDAVLGIKPE